MNTTLRRILVLYSIITAASYVIILLAYYFFPFFCTVCFQGNFIYPADASVTVVTGFQTWDAQHYLYLADQWYGPGQRSNAFYPLYPILIRGLSGVTHLPPILSALIISTVCAFIAVIFLFKLVRYLANEKIAERACVLFIFFPTAFYLHLPYGEALFLALVLGGFYFLYTQKSLFGMAIMTVLLPLSRPQGIFATVALAYQALRSKQYLRAIIITTAALLGIIIYFLILKLSTGFYTAGLYAQQYFESVNTINTLWHPLVWIYHNFIATSWTTIHAINESAINRFFFLAYVILLWPAYIYLDRSLFIYTIVVGGLTALSGDLVSWPRYMLLLFPLYIVLAHILKKKLPFAIMLASSGIIQLVFLILHSRNFWVA